jgi:hypothetical protein
MNQRLHLFPGVLVTMGGAAVVVGGLADELPAAVERVTIPVVEAVVELQLAEVVTGVLTLPRGGRGGLAFLTSISK